MAQRFGLTTKGDDLPTLSNVVRYVPYARMRRDADDMHLGPLPSAFEAREGEADLSVIWCEYFDNDAKAQLRCAIEILRNSRKIGPKGCFCPVKTSDLLAGIEKSGHKGRAVYLPVDGNLAHAGVYGVPPEDELLLSRLADEVWCSFLTKADADALPLSGCAKSVDVDPSV